MKRRAFIPLAAGFVLSRPTTAQTRVPVVGILDPADPEAFAGEVRKTLSGLGYVEGTTIRFEVRSGENDGAILARRAEELVRLKVDVIAARFTTALRSAMQATNDIPIVMAAVGGPVETGLVASLARPGGNVTGMSLGGVQIAGKRMQIIREVLPGARRVAMVGYAGDPFTSIFASTMADAGRAVGLEAVPSPATAETQRAMLDELVRERPDAIHTMANLPSKPTVDAALAARIPLFSTQRSGVVAGALMSYGGRLDEQFRGAAVHVDRILKGAKPASLPVQEPSRFELFINMLTARALGITIPPTLLAQADELIE